MGSYLILIPKTRKDIGLETLSGVGILDDAINQGNHYPR
jgi:hypothetical protein